MEMLIAGVSAATAGAICNPLEVVKIRMQLQGELKARGQYHVAYRYEINSTYYLQNFCKSLEYFFSQNNVETCSTHSIQLQQRMDSLLCRKEYFPSFSINFRPIQFDSAPFR
jgi:hypothetical protein